jgi:hypothetical protein
MKRLAIAFSLLPAAAMASGCDRLYPTDPCRPDSSRWEPMAAGAVGSLLMEMPAVPFLMPCLYVIFTHRNAGTSEVPGYVARTKTVASAPFPTP